jgi:hypothetical protein
MGKRKMMNYFVERYRSDGHPATASITVAKMPTAGDTVTIQGIVYAYRTNFVGIDELEVAKSLVATINAEPNSNLNPVPENQPVRNYYAIFYGRVVRLVATFPGVGGNAMTLTTTNATAFVLSGAVFAGGTAAGAVIP